MDISLHLNSVIENVSKPSDNKNLENKSQESDVEIKKHNYSNKLENFMN